MIDVTEAIVLVGGLGTRLRSVVGETPKALAPIAGRPFLDWLLDDLRVHGIARVVLATGFGSERIEERYRDGRPGLTIDISRESEPLGTGGALRLACARTTSSHVLAVNGDTFAAWQPERLSLVAARRRAPVTVGLKRVTNTDRYGSVTMDGDKLVGFREKHAMSEGLVNSGLYLLETAAMPWPPRVAFSFERDVLEPACVQGLLAGAILDGPFIDIGVPDAFAEAQKAIPEWAARGVD